MPVFDPIPIQEWEERTHLSLFGEGTSEATEVVSLRSIRLPLRIEILSIPFLTGLLRAVTLVGDSSVRVYAESTVDLIEVDPYGVEIGQLFVERRKVLGIMESFPILFSSSHCVKSGISRLPALRVIGKTHHGSTGVAYYIPPIVENGDNTHRLLDGIHRNYIVKAAGSTVFAVMVKRPCAPFPCHTRPWSEGITEVDAKPAMPDRFDSLRADLFRDLKRIGIDG